MEIIKPDFEMKESFKFINFMTFCMIFYDEEKLRGTVGQHRYNLSFGVLQNDIRIVIRFHLTLLAQPGPYVVYATPSDFYSWVQSSYKQINEQWQPTDTNEKCLMKVHLERRFGPIELITCSFHFVSAIRRFRI